MRFTCWSWLLLLSGVLMFHQNRYTIVFERIELVRYNKSFVNYAKVDTYKYNRTNACSNITIDNKINLGYDVKLEIQSHRFASNEYRLFPLRFSFNFCQFAARNEFGLEKLFACGNFSCPIKKGIAFMCKWFTDDQKFPPNVPAGSYMHHMKMFFGESEVIFLKGYGIVKYPLV